jgi:hypothetical protein
MLLSSAHFGDRNYTDLNAQLSKRYDLWVIKPVTSDRCHSALVLLWYDFERMDRTPKLQRTWPRQDGKQRENLSIALRKFIPGFNRVAQYFKPLNNCRSWAVRKHLGTHLRPTALSLDRV